MVRRSGRNCALAVQDPRLAASGEFQLLPLKQGRQLRLKQLQLAAGSARAEPNGALDLAPRRVVQLGMYLRAFQPGESDLAICSIGDRIID